MKVNVSLFNKTNDELNEMFKQELKEFAKDYGLTIEEAKSIVINMAAQRLKEVVTSLT